MSERAPRNDSCGQLAKVNDLKLVDAPLEISAAKMPEQAPRDDSCGQLAKVNDMKLIDVPPAIPAAKMSEHAPRDSIPNVTATPKLNRVQKYGKLAIRLGASAFKIEPCGEYIRLNEDNQPIWFETELFVGRIVVRVNRAENAPKTRYFDHNKRLFSCQVSLLIPLLIRIFCKTLLFPCVVSFFFAKLSPHVQLLSLQYSDRGNV